MIAAFVIGEYAKTGDVDGGGAFDKIFELGRGEESERFAGDAAEEPFGEMGVLGRNRDVCELVHVV